MKKKKYRQNLYTPINLIDSIPVVRVFAHGVLVCQIVVHAIRSVG